MVPKADFNLIQLKIGRKLFFKSLFKIFLSNDIK